MNSKLNTVQILLITTALLSLTTIVGADTNTNDDPLPDINDYSHIADSSETTTLGSTNGESTYIFHGYTIKAHGLFNLTLNTSQDNGLVIIRAVIGNNGVIRMEETVEEVLFEIIHSDFQPVDTSINRPAKKQWILVKPPGDVDVAVIHWERDGEKLLISGPIPFTDLGSSEATNSTEVFPPIID